MHWLQIDASNLAGKPGISRKLSSSGSIEGLRTSLGWIDDDELVHVDLSLQHCTDGIEVTGQAWGRMHLSCSRCLEEYVEDFRRNLDEMYYFESDLAEQREGYEVKDQVIDLEPMLRDAIVLNIPITPIHDEDCKGLCPLCGADLNFTDCGHVEQTTDIRWAPLQNLLSLQSGGEDEEVEK